MAVYAITGNPGSGKSTVAAFFKRRHVRVLDADSLVHRYYSCRDSVVVKKIRRVFPEVVHKGVVDRARLGNIVFSDARKLAVLEDIVHPRVVADIRAWVAGCRKDKAWGVVQIPLLYEKNLQGVCEGVMFIDTPAAVCAARLARRGIRHAAQRRKRFLPVAMKRKAADYIIGNSGNIQDLRKSVGEVWKRMQKKHI